MERNKAPLVTSLSSADKQLLGQICVKSAPSVSQSHTRARGIKFVGETIRRKSGKAAAK